MDALIPTLSAHLLRPFMLRRVCASFIAKRRVRLNLIYIVLLAALLPNILFIKAQHRHISGPF